MRETFLSERKMESLKWYCSVSETVAGGLDQKALGCPITNLYFICVDHGLYKEIDDKFRIKYAELWKSLMLVSSGASCFYLNAIFFPVTDPVLVL